MKYKQMINKKCTVCLVVIYLLVFNADVVRKGILSKF